MIRIHVGPYVCGDGHPLLLIAGPCVLEESVLDPIAAVLRHIRDTLGVSVVFKGSFDKANRTRVDSPRGPGLAAGLAMLDSVKQKYGLPVTTDIHESHQAAAVGEVCDLIQIPAFLVRQTDLLVAAAKTGKAVHAKKGQFLAPKDMQHVVGKLKDSGCNDIILCERGTFFGYGRLVNDMTSLIEMREYGAAVSFDATHSVQEPGGSAGVTGGNRKMVEPLARAAVAVGIDAMFLETHPIPDQSPSDGKNMLPLERIEPFVKELLRIRTERACA